MMKFALIQPWDFQVIYFETHQLAVNAFHQIELATGRLCKAIIIQVGEELPLPEKEILQPEDAEPKKKDRGLLMDPINMSMANFCKNWVKPTYTGRIARVANDYDIKTLGELLKLPRHDILMLDGMGLGGVKALDAAVGKINAELDGDLYFGMMP